VPADIITNFQWETESMEFYFPVFILEQSTDVEQRIDRVDQIQEKIFPLKAWLSEIIEGSSFYNIYVCYTNRLSGIENTIILEKKIGKILDTHFFLNERNILDNISTIRTYRNA
jgi:hypothetical protein